MELLKKFVMVLLFYIIIVGLVLFIDWLLAPVGGQGKVWKWFKSRYFRKSAEANG